MERDSTFIKMETDTKESGKKIIAAE